MWISENYQYAFYTYILMDFYYGETFLKQLKPQILVKWPKIKHAAD